MNIDRWKSQLRKGAAELTILALLESEPLTGSQLLDRLKIYQELGLSDGTLYPLLSRLERDGRIKGNWTLPEDGSRPSKKYTLTPNGTNALQDMRQAWKGFRNDVSTIVGDKNES